MLNQVLALVIITWFIVVPLIFDIRAWFKNKPVLQFFRYSFACKCCIFGYILTSLIVDIEITPEIRTGIPNVLKVYCILALVFQVAWSSYKYIYAYRISADLLNNCRASVSYAIATHFGDTQGYNYLTKYFPATKRAIWEILKSTESINDLSDDMKSYLRDYTLDAERKAVDTENPKLLASVIKTKMYLLEDISEVKQFYAGIINNTNKTEEQQVISNLITGNPRLFKMI